MALILYEVRERVAILTLNRPDQRNAQNPPLLPPAPIFRPGTTSLPRC
jgi:enoyl-CoA hydratase/carnithine racemase